MKRTEKILLTIVAIAQAAFLVLAGVFVYNYVPEKAEEDNTKDAYSVFVETVEDIKTEQDVDTKNAEDLYLSLYNNESLTDKEKKRLTNYLQYFVDNKYLDCEEVCNKLSSFTVNKNNPDLLEVGIAAEYLEDNSITFANKKEREFALPHEIHHCIENAAMPYETMDWFGEGFACLVVYEYFNTPTDGDSSLTFFVRSMCELVGPEVLFETSATGDPDVLVNALVDRGIAKKDIRKLFKLFSEIKVQEIDYGEDVREMKIECVKILVDMYNTVYDNPKKISTSFYKSADKFFQMNSDRYDSYYINSQKRNTFDLQKKYVSQKKMDELYEIVMY